MSAILALALLGYLNDGLGRRHAFIDKLNTLGPDATTKEIRRVLGKPDRIKRWIPKLDSRTFEEWDYGVTAKGTVTLAKIHIIEGWAREIEGRKWDVKPLEGLTETKLREAMDYAAEYKGTLGSIRLANFLIDTTPAAATTVVRECARLPHLQVPAEFVMMLAQAAPTRTLEDVLVDGRLMMGDTFVAGDIPLHFTPFLISRARVVRNVETPSLPAIFALRRRKLEPSSKPFEVLLDIHDFLARNLPEEKLPELERGPTWTVLELVSSAFRPKTYVPRPTLETLQEWSKEWDRMGGHWDAKRQMYVRGDGSILTGAN